MRRRNTSSAAPPRPITGMFVRFERFGGKIAARVIVERESGGQGIVTLFDPPDDLVAGEQLVLARDADRRLVLRERRL